MNRSQMSRSVADLHGDSRPGLRRLGRVEGESAYSFQGGAEAGSVPAGAVVFDKQGNLYGVTSGGAESINSRRQRSRTALGPSQLFTYSKAIPMATVQLPLAVW